MHRTAVAAVGSIALVAALVSLPGAAAAQGTSTSATTGKAAAVGSTAGGPTSRRHVLSTRAGRPIPRPAGLPASAAPATVARAVVASRADDLGLTGALVPAGTTTSAAGGHIVRLQQRVAGAPVLAGEVVVDLDAAGRTRSIISETLPGSAPAVTTAAVSADEARATAVDVVVKASGHAASDLVADEATTWVYDPRMFGAPGAPRAVLVWRTEVTSPVDVGVRHEVLVDAVTGKLVADIDEIQFAATQRVCDAGNSAAKVPCLAGGAVANPGASSGDVRNAYDYANKTYDFYSDVLGRDSIDGAGMTLISTVKYCPLNDTATTADDCPFENAFWNGQQMVYGASYASADDVVAHELTHGVTEHDNELFYYYQSGAINESLSDIFGEFVDLTDGVGTDTPGVEWLMGEDLPIGAIRNMKDPTVSMYSGDPGQPDRTGSSLWSDEASYLRSFDSGGVHTNSGVGNKFAYLIVDGATFNNQVVAPLEPTRAASISKASWIISQAAKTLPSGADYITFGRALQTACTALIGQTKSALGAGTVTFDAADCSGSVEKAVAATQMLVTPARAALTQAPVCSAGTVSTTLFADDMEGAASVAKWVATGTGVPENGNKPMWFHGTSPNPYGASAVYATSGGDNLWGDDPSLGYATDHSMQMKTGVTVPAGTTYVRFDHAYGFEWGPDVNGTVRNYDGGRVEYSVNGAGWLDAGPLMTSGTNSKYNGVVAAGFGNPAFANKAAFVRSSKGYVSTRINLSGLAGKSVRLRFRVAADATVGDYGWYIDNVRLYRCTPPLNLSVPPTVSFAATAASYTVTDPMKDAAPGTVAVSYRTRTGTAAAGLGAYGAWKTAPSSRVVPLAAPATGGASCVEVRLTIAAKTQPTQVRCTARPVDDRGLRPGTSTQWRKVSAKAAYGSTLRTTKVKGASLTLPVARGSRIVVVAETFPGAGTVSVFVGKTRVGTISLASARATYRRTFEIKAGSKGAAVRIVVVRPGTKGVAIDGVALRP